VAKLTIELIPRTCFFSNVRSNLPKKEWDRIRKISYENANHKCEICGETGKEQGYNRNVDCHEIWAYDDKKCVQILEGLISLCPRCHMTKHFGRSSAVGKQAEVFKHMEKVNGWNHKECLKHLAEAMMLFVERSKMKWLLDIKILEAQYGVPKKLINETYKNRK
jgi:hypothetical protein